MSQTFPRSEILAALDSVACGVATKSHTPLLTHVLFKGGAAWSWDGEIGARAALPSGLKNLPDFNVRFDGFLATIRKLPADELRIDVERSSVRVSAGGHVSRHARIDEPFPLPQVKIKSSDWRSLPAGFADAAKKLSAVASGHVDDNLAGSGLYVTANRMFHRPRGSMLLRVTFEADLPTFLLTPRGAAEMAKVGSPRRVAALDAVAAFDFVNMTLLCRLKDHGQFPTKVESIFDGRRGAAVPIPEGFGGALDRLLVFAKKNEVPGVTAENDGGGRLRLSGSAGGRRDDSDAEEILSDGPIPDEPIGFNAEQIAAALRYADVIDWGDGTPGKGIYLAGPDGFEFISAGMTTTRS